MSIEIFLCYALNTPLPLHWLTLKGKELVSLETAKPFINILESKEK